MLFHVSLSNALMQVFTNPQPKGSQRKSASSTAMKVNLQLPIIIGHAESLLNDTAGLRRIKSAIVEDMRLLEGRTSHIGPVPLGIRSARDRVPKRSTMTRPSCLSDPHPRTWVHLVHAV